MDPRQRVLTALSHREPDKVPLDLGGTENTTITRLAYINLREHLGMPADPAPWVINRQMDAVQPPEDLCRRYQIDCRGVRVHGQPRTREMPDDSFYDEYNIRWKKAAYYYDAVERPLATYALEDLPRAAWPSLDDPQRFQGLKEAARALYEGTDYCLVGGHITWGPFELACALRGYDQFCVELYDDTSLAEALLDRITDTAIAFWDAYLAQVGEYVQVVAQGDDLGMQTGPFISPQMYRRFIKPRHRRLYDFIHSRTRARVFMHSCGSVYDLIPDLIEVGVDILSPVQRSAAKMDIARLKREFGRDLTFWGAGIDVQQVLPYASLDEIRDGIARTFDILAPGGGFVFVATHNIQADIAPERIDTVYETALARRSYGARTD